MAYSGCIELLTTFNLLNFQHFKIQLFLLSKSEFDRYRNVRMSTKLSTCQFLPPHRTIKAIQTQFVLSLEVASCLHATRMISRMTSFCFFFSSSGVHRLAIFVVVAICISARLICQMILVQNHVPNQREVAQLDRERTLRQFTNVLDCLQCLDRKL